MQTAVTGATQGHCEEGTLFNPKEFGDTYKQEIVKRLWAPHRWYLGVSDLTWRALTRAHCIQGVPEKSETRNFNVSKSFLIY